MGAVKKKICPGSGYSRKTRLKGVNRLWVVFMAAWVVLAGGGGLWRAKSMFTIGMWGSCLCLVL